MFLGVDELLQLVKEKKLVEGLCERELTNPEGAGFDLRLGEVFKIEGNGFLGQEERETPKGISVVQYSEKEKRTVTIKPGEFYLVKTIEKVNLPDNLVGILMSRGTMQRMGLFLKMNQIGPGYFGELTFALKNEGPSEVTIEMGARIAHVMFEEVKGKTHLYRGQWKGGRVVTEKREKQV